MLKFIVICIFSFVVLIGLGAVALDLRYGGGELFPDRSGTPIMGGDLLEKVADLEYPPGNIAVSQDGRIFFSFHPEGRPSFNLAELVDGAAIPIVFSTDHPINLSTVLSLRIDQQNRLWLLDYADHGQETPQIVAIDLDTMTLIHHHVFDPAHAGFGSHLNDFQVSADGSTIYIADASILGLNPAILIYDVASKTTRRVLEDHASVEADDYVPVVEGQKMLMFGVLAIRPGVDSIALDRSGEWLYFAPVTDEHMHRVRISDLHKLELSASELAERVEQFAEKTMSDGITMDNENNIYISDLEHSAIVRMNKNGEMATLIKDPKLRWPDGFSFGPDGYLYVTASALQDVIFKPASYISEKGPYQIYRLKTETSARAGH